MEIKIMEFLKGLRAAEQIMRESNTAHSKVTTLDRCYHSLDLRERSPINKASSVYAEIKSYFELSATRYCIDCERIDVFRVERRVEFGKLFRHGQLSRCNGDDRRLPWHGTPWTNFTGILS